MSRNRAAILADIVEFNLDPNVAHKGTHANGRLAKSAFVTDEVPVVEEKQPEASPVISVEEPKNELVEAPVEQLVAEEVEQPVEQAETVDEEPKVDAPSKKKGKKQFTE